MKRLLLLPALCLTWLCASALQPQRGYRGMFESSNYLIINPGFLTGDGGSSTVFAGFATSHGFQFNSWLYAGGGAGFEYNLNWKKHRNSEHGRWVIPLFAEGRLDARWDCFTPYFSARLGANLADHGGVYFSPTVGYRFNWGRKSSINFSMGMSLYGRRFTSREHILEPGGGITLGPETHYQGHDVLFTVRLGYDFQL